MEETDGGLKEYLVFSVSPMKIDKNKRHDGLRRLDNTIADSTIEISKAVVHHGAPLSSNDLVLPIPS